MALWWRHDRASRETVGVALTAEIDVLPPAERVRLANESWDMKPVPGRVVEPRRVPLIPLEQADNPILLTHTYARVVVRNPTSRDCTLIAFRHPDGNLNPEYMKCFVIDPVIHDAAGNEVPPGERLSMSSRTERVPPFGAALKAENLPTFNLTAGGSFVLPLEVLNGHTGRNLRPGSFTIRARVTYADARDGEARVLTTDPITIEVTQQHIDFYRSFIGEPPD